jgi:hypothetical protein
VNSVRGHVFGRHEDLGAGYTGFDHSPAHDWSCQLGFLATDTHGGSIGG